jgi:hypothetical protein
MIAVPSAAANPTETMGHSMRDRFDRKLFSLTTEREDQTCVPPNKLCTGPSLVVTK